MKKRVDFIGVAIGVMLFDDDGRVFLNKRSTQAKNARGCWEFPGGGVEFSELRIDAAKREMQEEFGVDIEILSELHTVEDILPDEGQHWVATTYISRLKEGEVPCIMEAHKSDKIGWFDLQHLPEPLSEITKKDLLYFLKRNGTYEKFLKVYVRNKV